MEGKIEGSEKCYYSLNRETQGRNGYKERVEWHFTERGRANRLLMLNSNQLDRRSLHLRMKNAVTRKKTKKQPNTTTSTQKTECSTSNSSRNLIGDL